MSDFSKSMRLKEKAEEDMYFAKRDRELIEALHEEQSEQPAGGSDETTGEMTSELDQNDAVSPGGRWYTRWSFARWLRRLAGKAPDG